MLNQVFSLWNQNLILNVRLWLIHTAREGDRYRERQRGQWVLICCTELFTLVWDWDRNQDPHCFRLCWSSYLYLFRTCFHAVWISHYSAVFHITFHECRTTLLLSVILKIISGNKNSRQWTHLTSVPGRVHSFWWRLGQGRLTDASLLRLALTSHCRRRVS